MRTVPESIKLALEDAALPIKKRILMYRRVWNAQDSKYLLETDPIEMTDLLVEVGNIKMALDTDEVDKWDASNVTLTFNNELNCFKEGLSGGLFEQAVLWGSKFVYQIENAEKDAPQDSIAVFTGYVYASPVFRANGNQIELTITSSLDALEYVSAEEFCQHKTDEEAVAVTAKNKEDQGKEFTSVETGVGYIDTVKYGVSLETAITLSAGSDYEVSDDNEYDKPAVVKLNFTPTVGYKMWLTYRHWHKDMKIEDIVNALLDLAGVEKRQVEAAVYDSLSGGAVGYNYLNSRTAESFLIATEDQGDVLCDASAFLAGSMSLGASWANCLSYSVCNTTSHVTTEAPIGTGIYFVFNPKLSYDDNASQNDRGGFGLTDKDGNGVYCGTRRDPVIEKLEVHLLSGWGLSGVNGRWTEYIPCGMSCIKQDDSTLVSVWGEANGYLKKLNGAGNTLTGVRVDRMGAVGERTGKYGGCTQCQTAYLDYIPGEEELQSKKLADFKKSSHYFTTPVVILPCQALPSFKGWNKITAMRTQENDGFGTFWYADSDDGVKWSELEKVNLNQRIPSPKEYLRVYYKLDSLYAKKEFINSLTVSQFLSSAEIPLANLSELTVGEAIAQLAKMVSYEIGFDQEGVFFFRARQGRYTEVELEASRIIEVDNHAADVDSLVNRVTVEYGNFKTTVDDITEEKLRPNSIDTYGVHEKEISDDNFIPADNVDISHAVAQANYETLSTPGYCLQVDCRPELGLELGDKITVSCENQDIADPQASNLAKFKALPMWKRVFKVMGIELCIDKRLMTLNLKDVTSDDDVPNMDYVNYQTTFPAKLDYKE